MSSDLNRPVRLEITVNASSPKLLAGFEYWLQLGLLSDRQVRQLSQRYLTCSIPEPIIVVEKPKISTLSTRELDEIPVPIPPKRKPVTQTVSSSQSITRSQPSGFEKILQSFKEELSLRWLFFLGIFLIIVSSGVLAASQWQNISSFGQYGVLYLYTLIFGLSGWWTGKNAKLKLTSQTLKIVSLLLIPINFIAMDSFELWNNIIGWLVIAIATLSLSTLPFLFARQSIAIEASLFLGLCYLNWGWNFANFPLLAIYLGAIPTVILWQRKFSRSQKLEPSPLFFILFALIVLVIRGLFIEQLPLTQLGLAIGIGGWLCAVIVPALKKKIVLTKNLEIVGILFIIVGWELSLRDGIIWQSLATSSLGFWCFLQRLKRYWHWGDLLALFAIAAQGFVLCVRLVSLDRWDRLFATLANLTSYQDIPALFAVSAAFAYSFIFIGYMAKLYRLDKPNLAYFGEGLALSLGGVTCLATVFMPALRSLSLFLWAISFLIVAHRFKVRYLPIYCAHIIGAIAVFSLLPWFYPDTEIETYGMLLSIWAIAEWLVFTRLEKNRIRDSKTLPETRLSIWSLSCWGLGYIGAIGSYFCAGKSMTQTPMLLLEQSLVLLSIPLILTFISRIGHPRDRNIIFVNLGEGLALILGGVTCFCVSSFSELSLALFFWTISGLMIAHRPRVRPFLIYLAHFSGAIAILSLFPWLFPTLTTQNYTIIFLIWAIAEWTIVMGLTKIQIADLKTAIAQRLGIWSLSCWHLGFMGAIGSYLLASIPQKGSILAEPALPWLLVPLTLTITARVSPPRRQEAVFASTIALFAIQVLLVEQPFPRLAGLAVATGLMVVNANFLKQVGTALISIGFGLGLGVAVLWEKIEIAEWSIAGAIAVVCLWGLYRFLKSKAGDLANIYREAADIWAIILAITLLSGLSAAIAAGYGQISPPHWTLFVAPIVLTGAIAFRGKSHPTNESLWGMAWGLELIVSGGLLFLDASILTLAAVHVLIGFLMAIDFLFDSRSLLSPFNRFRFLPLLYGLLGLALRWESFTAQTGFLTIGVALTGVAIGVRRPGWRGLSYLSLAGISVGLYELTLYQMLQGSGGSPADGVTILATVAVAIALIYRFVTWYLHGCDREAIATLQRIDLVWAGNIHWAIANFLMGWGLLFGLTSPSKLRLLGTIIWGILSLYAALQGRGVDKPKINDLWIVLGVIEAGLFAIHLQLLWPELMVLGLAAVPVGCAIALALYSFPWQHWGWRKHPWQYSAIVIPPLVLFSELPDISTLNLLIVSAFYLRVAQQSKNWRWSYFALGFCNWAIARFFQDNQLQDPLWYVSLISLSLIYIAQFDPTLQNPAQQKNRHLLRVVGSSLTSVVALVLHSETGLVPCAIGLLAVFIGLGLKVRAFLYVGTITFLLATLYQLLILIFQYAFVKWVIGLVAGIVLIIVAANFERSRDRVSSTWQNWLAQLNAWE
ncbi:MAG: hypothetical protein J7647_17025 [Cyanobacteria bacterium SBLK]|nr:hypothetical protein [Cyanobacteria bacterium SBLK]